MEGERLFNKIAKKKMKKKEKKEVFLGWSRDPESVSAEYNGIELFVSWI